MNIQHEVNDVTRQEDGIRGSMPNSVAWWATQWSVFDDVTTDWWNRKPATVKLKIGDP